MTKVYLVKTVRVNKEGFIYQTVENVFTNRKKAKIYLEWIQKKISLKIPSYIVVRYKIEEWNINTLDYSKLPY